MVRDRRDVRRLFPRLLRFVIVVFLVGVLSSCTAAAGGGVLVVLAGIGALTSHCYDYLDVTVFDAQGRKSCAATVTALRANSSEQFELESCYYTPLTDGHWTLRASMPGSRDVETVVDVSHEEGCTRHVQSVELTLSDPGLPVRSAAPKPGPTPAISASSAPPALSMTSAPTPIPPAPSAVVPDGNPAPSNAAGGASSAAGGGSSSTPTTAGSSSIGVFPTNSEPSP